MARRPALAKAAASCSSSVDLPMPGSPPISSAEPGTMPPPVTRSSSARPVGMRGDSCPCPWPASPARRRGPSRPRSRPEPGGGAGVGLLDQRVPLAAGGALAGPARGARRRSSGRRTGSWRLWPCASQLPVPRRRDRRAGRAGSAARSRWCRPGRSDRRRVTRSPITSTQAPRRASSGGTSVTSTVMKSIDTRPTIGTG